MYETFFLLVSFDVQTKKVYEVTLMVQCPAEISKFHLPNVHDVLPNATKHVEWVKSFYANSFRGEVQNCKDGSGLAVYQF